VSLEEYRVVVELPPAPFDLVVQFRFRLMAALGELAEEHPALAELAKVALTHVERVERSE
jgi:hypothetical protein